MLLLSIAGYRVNPSKSLVPRLHQGLGGKVSLEIAKLSVDYLGTILITPICIPITGKPLVKLTRNYTHALRMVFSWREGAEQLPAEATLPQIVTDIVSWQATDATD
jgi:hypothetical protein